MSGWRSTKDGRHFQTGRKPGLRSDNNTTSSNSGSQSSSMHQPTHKTPSGPPELFSKTQRNIAAVHKQEEADRNLAEAKRICKTGPVSDDEIKLARLWRKGFKADQEQKAYPYKEDIEKTETAAVWREAILVKAERRVQKLKAKQSNILPDKWTRLAMYQAEEALRKAGNKATASRHIADSTVAMARKHKYSIPIGSPQFERQQKKRLEESKYNSKTSMGSANTWSNN